MELQIAACYIYGAGWIKSLVSKAVVGHTSGAAFCVSNLTIRLFYNESKDFQELP